jgi:Fe-S-cluster containining protein
MASSVLTYDAFVCKKCGVCCKKQKVVLLTIYDIFRISSHLGTSPNAFFKKYCMRSTKFNSDGLKRFYLRADGGCPFLRDNLCSIQEVKPVVCARNPFYYLEASLAAYKVFGIIEDECHVNEYPYDTMAKGDNERLIDMDILVKVTDEYIARYGRFDEKAASRYYDKSLAGLNDPKLRALTYNTLVGQSVSREEMCRTDPYYMGAANMYLSGFYGEFRRAVKEAGDNGNGSVLAFEPSALGTIDNVVTLILFEKDYHAVKKALAQGEGADVAASSTVYAGREYDIVTIKPGIDKKVIFYYHIEPKDKKELRHGPGEITIRFKSEKGGAFVFRGRDADGWMKQ